jgi:FtsP/CotA-like multicopper oxidase with cupredoxin domain
LEKRDPNYISLNTNKNITNLTLGVPFTDLRKSAKIDVRRMRPLIWVGNNTFTINGRTDFHKGLSENPVLGSIEDWFLINTIFFPHPIHVHLINFQVIKEYDLRVMIPSNNTNNYTGLNCALYELDFTA